MKPRGGGRERAAGGRGPGPPGAPGPGAPRTALPGAAIPNPPKLQLDGSAPGPATRAASVGRLSPRTRACQGGAAGAGAEPGGRRRGGARGSHLGVVVQMVPAHVGRRADTEGSEAARGKRRGRSGRPEQADGVSREDEQTATAAAGPRLPGQLRRRRQRRRR